MIKECVNASRITILNGGDYDGWVNGAEFPIDITDAAEVGRCHLTVGDRFVEIPLEVLEKHGYDRKVGIDYHDYASGETGLIFLTRQGMYSEVEIYE